MNSALVAALFILMLAGGIGFGASLSLRKAKPPPRSADDRDIDEWYADLWWTR
ncbi:hypothetical protein [Mycolicibacterium anyangense]|uniref:hypothetical protein n=1 Tax=Mycolicibacterium anyangense TaxID=1431246 RepID=UPI0013D3C025|nr:hypothetical protein [Mycolicibacterium anyangense]